MTAVFSTWGVSDPKGASSPPSFPPDLGLRAFMGWDGLIICDDSVDVVDMAREYAARARAESCGQCFPCRLGTAEVADILERICAGRGAEHDLDRLEILARYVRESARCDIGQTAPRPLLDALEYFRNEFLAAVRNAKPLPRGSYVWSVTAPCITACPAHVDIPGYVEKIRVDRWDEALDLVRNTCFMPGTIGRICFRNCERKCRRGVIDESVAIKNLKRYAADREAAARYVQTHSPPVLTFHRYVADREITPGNSAAHHFRPVQEEKVAIVGAGPAGLSCAYYLGVNGYRSTIFEAAFQPGGTAAERIPASRLPRDILQREADLVEKLGSDIRYGVTVGEDITIQELLNEGYLAVFISVGAPKFSTGKCKIERFAQAGIKVASNNTLVVDPVTLQSAVPYIFCGGDCVTGQSMIVAALAAGRRAAKSIIQYLETGDCSPDEQDRLDLFISALNQETAKGDAPIEALSNSSAAGPAKRGQRLSKLKGELTPTQARKEASRCLRCYRIALAVFA
ncbi:MAG: NADH-ubiquinone oxidoreductase-F iron-sulfur binding region domain-containing protein [Desulfovibrionales bacterium]|nr:NADH-ubiquinone oxidoreductase-F iron-sulfur binding region domain-containing protein [Desulfovibrionales bacterium]